MGRSKKQVGGEVVCGNYGCFLRYSELDATLQSNINTLYPSYKGDNYGYKVFLNEHAYKAELAANELAYDALGADYTTLISKDATFTINSTNDMFANFVNLINPKIQNQIQGNPNTLYIIPQFACTNDGFAANTTTLLTKLVSDISTAIKKLHTKRLYHRDIKPENIVLCGDTFKLIDFGFLANIATIGEETSAQGTPEYISPEYRNWKNQLIKPKPEPTLEEKERILKYNDWYAFSMTLYAIALKCDGFPEGQTIGEYKYIDPDDLEPFYDKIPDLKKYIDLDTYTAFNNKYAELYPSNGGKKLPKKSLVSTDKRVVFKGRTRKVYSGPRGGEYIKVTGEFFRIGSLGGLLRK